MRQQLKKNHRCFLQGFTLVELLVTSALFSVVITIAVGALLSAQTINIRLKQTQTVLDGVNLATEIMVRDIRYGLNFYCDTAVPASILLRKECPHISGVPGATVLFFKPTAALVGTTNDDLDRIAYYLENGTLYKKEYPYGGTERTYQLTSNNVTISTLGFYSSGLYSSQSVPTRDYNQAIVTIVLSGVTVGSSSVAPVTFSMQTSATSRLLDN
jgi:prepilin-type N-terminal cleavage/methylation domain-containing protein